MKLALKVKQVHKVNVVRRARKVIRVKLVLKAKQVHKVLLV